ncbi:MAG TPA: thioredoxin family protein [Ignavibacteriales bacterium]|nr:thioredoxin family protein [Ignavibacteriales bacterium]
MDENILIANRLYKALSYSQYLERTKIRVLTSDATQFDEELLQKFEYSRLNLQRSLRIEKVYSVSDDLKNLVLNLPQEHLWVVITEDWCGDSAQTVPYIAKIAAASPKVELAILLRDENLDIIDQYLTNGTRSIPKLIGFDKNWNELYRWGPRPRALQELFQSWKLEDIPREKLYENLQAWYNNNHGKELEREFMEMVRPFLI